MSLSHHGTTVPFRRAFVSCAATAVAFVALAADTPAATGGVTQDFLVTSLQVNQVIQTGSTPLTAGRSTMVRATVRMTDFSQQPVFVDGLMRVFKGGVEVADSPVFSSNGPFPATVPPGPETDGDARLNFIFVAPAGNDIVVEVEINPAGPNFVPEVNTANNKKASAPLTFTERNVPEMAFAPIDYRPTGGPTPNLPDPALIEPGVGDSFIQGIYPGKDWYYHRIDAPSKLWTSSLSGSGSALNNSLTVDAGLMVPQPDFIYGWVPGSLPYNGQSIIGGVASMGNTQPIRHQRTFAHEVGHCTGLFHNSVVNNILGIDVEHHLNLTEGLPQFKVPNLNDIMVPGLLTPQAWISPLNYGNFLNHPSWSPSSDALTFDGGDDGPQLMLAGVWNTSTGAVEITDVLEVPAGHVTAAAPLGQADLLVQAFDGTSVVRSLPIASRSSNDTCTGCAEHGDADSAFQTPILGFTVNLPAGTPLDRLVVSQAGARPASTVTLLRSAAMPEVTFTSPVNGALVDGQVSWTAADADGDALTYYLLYSPDGERMVPLATTISENSWSVDLGALPAFVNGVGHFELIASDGLNVVRVESDVLGGSETYFGEGGNPPWVEVVTPDDGYTFLEGATVILHSSGWDLEDRAIEDAGISWASDLDGPLGGGRVTSAQLSAGTHQITVTAVDSGGLMATDTATVEVTARDLPTGGGGLVCQADLGFGGPGSSVLSVCGGDLSSGNDATLSITGAPASTMLWLASGLVNDPQPLKGGLLVPNPATILVPGVTDGAGEVTLPVPGGLGPATFYTQAVVVDGGQALGFGFSNAVEIVLLP